MWEEHREKVGRAVREALVAAGEADGHELVLAVSLGYAGSDELPAAGPALQMFVDGPAYAAVCDLAGQWAAEIVRAHLLDALADELAEPGERPVSAPRPRATGTPLDRSPEQRTTLRVERPLDAFERPTVPPPGRRRKAS